MYAVIKTGGKQYRVAEGDVIEIERLPGEAGDELIFDEVLLLGADDATEVGRPTVAGATVTGRILAQDRARKIIVFKMKRRKNYRRKRGHRQNISRVKILSVGEGVETEASPAVAEG